MFPENLYFERRVDWVNKFAGRDFYSGRKYVVWMVWVGWGWMINRDDGSRRIKMARIITSTITIYLCQHNICPLWCHLASHWSVDSTAGLWLAEISSSLRLVWLQLTPNILRDLFMSPPRPLSDGHQEKEQFFSSSPRKNINWVERSGNVFQIPKVIK